MNRWYRYMGTMINLDLCGFLHLEEKDNCFRIHFFNSKGEIFHSFRFPTREELMETYDKIQRILMEKTINISELTQEIKELREAIMYLPVIGSEYQEAKEDFNEKKVVANK